MANHEHLPSNGVWFQDGDPQASRPAPFIAKSAADVDDFGWPKAPIEHEELSEEQVQEQERRRQEILDNRQPSNFPKPLDKQPVPLKSHMTQEEFDELDYPKVPEEWDAEWMRQQIEKQSVDPRENPNLLIDECQQEYWFNATRKPYAKAILRSEQHWTNRRNVWFKQYETIENMNTLRETVAEELEDCSMEVKRLVTPILHHKVTEIALKTYVREAAEHKIPLSQLLQDPSKLRELHNIRLRIDRGGDEAAAQMLAMYTETVERCMEDRRKQKEEAERGQRVISDTDSMAKIMNMVQRCKKDGHIEWNNGNAEEALSSWRLADSYIKKHKLPDENKSGNRMIADEHIAVLKNVAQAAIKLGYWTEALEAAESALRIDDQDHKAWFRKACALEGLGRFDEEEEALEKIDDIAVGRPDRSRIQKDLDAKRTKLQSIKDHDKEVQRKGFTRAVARGIFSEERAAKALATEAPAQQLGHGGDEPPALPAAPPCPFKEGDAIVVQRTIADLERGLRGTVVEVDADGDVRIQFEGHEDVEMLLSEDLGHLAVDTGEPLEPAPEEHLGTCEAQLAEASEPPPTRRKKLTKDSAAELLEELRHVYDDTLFRKQVAKLARDVRWDPKQFVPLLRKVALEVQRPALEKWGFDASPEGIAEVEVALQDYTRRDPKTGLAVDSALKEKSDAVTRLLYGEMYEVVFREYARPAPPPAPAQGDGDHP